ncbi:hypothetical protein RISK_005319 [Rhodopirellula islandica]|uniref:Uncharacterized protein n=1 Tax=Rhodopirellula islandica TaxID=595434 RepID=A0A0J1B6N1_RHOIS|nr:hypothetical protein RISK_005319 [Rhodopirellula islandica]
MKEFRMRSVSLAESGLSVRSTSIWQVAPKLPKFGCPIF